MLLIELMIDGIVDTWFAVMQWVVPEKAMGRITRMIVKVIVEIFTFFLFISMVLGIFAIISDEPETRKIGRYMVLIPIAVSAVEILLGIVVRTAHKKK